MHRQTVGLGKMPASQAQKWEIERWRFSSSFSALRTIILVRIRMPSPEEADLVAAGDHGSGRFFPDGEDRVWDRDQRRYL
jgi:hypothetical protein